MIDLISDVCTKLFTNLRQRDTIRALMLHGNGKFDANLVTVEQCVKTLTTCESIFTVTNFLLTISFSYIKISSLEWFKWGIKLQMVRYD